MSTSAPAQEEKRTDSQESLSWKPDGLIGRGRFKLVRFIAQGGMGIVWEAFDTKLKERVAVKTVPAELRSNFPAFDHLRREIVRNRALSHPNIVRIHDLYEEEGEEPFIVMELVDGRGLNEWQAEQDDGVFDWEWFKPFLLQICDALAYAHQRNIVHRDLKPANVLLGADGQIKLIDFGLATHFTDALHPMSRSLGASGTTAYMSPQQVEGWPSTAQDDIYALGATLFELLTGQPPFVGGDLAHQVANHPPPKLQERVEQRGLNRTIPGEAELFVGACLVKDTAVRPKTVEALVETLAGTSAGWSSAVAAQPDGEPFGPSEPQSLGEGRSRRSKMWIYASLGLVGAAALIGWGIGTGYRLGAQNDIANRPVEQVQEADDNVRLNQGSSTMRPNAPLAASVSDGRQAKSVRGLAETSASYRRNSALEQHFENYFSSEFLGVQYPDDQDTRVEFVRRPKVGNGTSVAFTNRFKLGPGTWISKGDTLELLLGGDLSETYLVAEGNPEGVRFRVKAQGASVWVGGRRIREGRTSSLTAEGFRVLDYGVLLGSGSGTAELHTQLWNCLPIRGGRSTGEIAAEITGATDTLLTRPWRVPDESWSLVFASDARYSAAGTNISDWQQIDVWHEAAGNPTRHADFQVNGRIVTAPFAKSFFNPKRDSRLSDLFVGILVRIRRVGQEPAAFSIKNPIQ